MKIAVLVKSVPDTASELQVTPDGKSVATAQLKHVMSPYDEHAVEQAIRLKESHGAEVVVVSAEQSSAEAAEHNAKVQKWYALRRQRGEM